MLAALVPPGRENEAVFGSAKGQSDGWSERLYLTRRTPATLVSPGRRGGVVTQRPAKPFTPVRFRSAPSELKPNRARAVQANSDVAVRPIPPDWRVDGRLASVYRRYPLVCGSSLGLDDRLGVPRRACPGSGASNCKRGILGGRCRRRTWRPWQGCTTIAGVRASWNWCRRSSTRTSSGRRSIGSGLRDATRACRMPRVHERLAGELRSRDDADRGSAVGKRTVGSSAPSMGWGRRSGPDLTTDIQFGAAFGIRTDGRLVEIHE